MMKSPISFKKINMNECQLVCTCKKSSCLKKYCECFQAGMKCSSFCKCVDCKNRMTGCTERNCSQSQEEVKKEKDFILLIAQE